MEFQTLTLFGRRFFIPAQPAIASMTQVAYHKAKRLSEMVVPGMPEERPDEEVSSYDDWQADFHAPFHVLEPAEEYVDCLQPEPVPQCYGSSQLLARQLLAQQSNGIVYPSVRHKGGRCLACFRPALVYEPRQAERYVISLHAAPHGYKTT